MHRLPRPRLVPLCLKTPAVRRFISGTYDALSAEGKARADAFYSACMARMAREHPWRVMNQRRRLYACHWAGWQPAWIRPPRISTLFRATPYERWGATGRKWLLSRTAPRIAR